MPRLRKPPSERVEKAPTLTPGASQRPINPQAGLPGAQRGPLGSGQVLQGTRASAAIQSNEPSKYTDMRPDQPPNAISDVDLDRNWFSPFQPITPFGPPYVTTPRAFDYQVGINYDFLPARLTLFEMLRGMSQTWGLLRAVIETRKDQMLRIPWEIRKRDTPTAPGKPKDKWAQEITEFFRKPDKKNRYERWKRMLLEDLFVIDAPTLYTGWRDGNGQPYAIEVLDGATIKPLVDDGGRRPDYPNPAFQQIIKGLPLINLDETELIYAPMRPRSQLPIYGYSPVEQLLLEVTQGIRRTIYQTNFWTEGTLPDLIVNAPETWTPQQIAQFQAFFDAMLEGNLRLKSKVRFIPGGMKPFDIKNSDGSGLKTEYDEWMARLICFCFSMSPQPFVKMMNRATAETAQQEAEEEGLHPLMSWDKNEVMDPIIQERFGYEDYEFIYIAEPEVDQVKQQTVLSGYVKVGIYTPDEAREELNKPPLPDGAGAEAIVETASGPVPLKETIEANRQKALSVPDELQRAQEQHDKSMAEPAPGAKPAKKYLDVLKASRRRLAPIPFDRPIVRKALASIKKATAKALHKARDDAIHKVRAELGKIAKAKTPKQTADDIADDVDLSSLNVLVDDVGEALAEVASDAAALALAQIGPDLPQELVDQVSESAVEMAWSLGAELVGMRYDADGNLVEAARAEYRIDESTRDMLRDIIADGLEENIGTDAIADKIAEATAFSEDRADLIARTEVSRANSKAALDGYQSAADETGLSVMKEWLLGENPCEFCEANAADGPIALDDAFSGSDDTEPPAHPNCECAIAPVVEGPVEEIAKLLAKQKKMTQAEVGYVDSAPSDDHCSICTMFRRKKGKFLAMCSAVEGDINPNGWCTIFEEK